MRCLNHFVSQHIFHTARMYTHHHSLQLFNFSISRDRKPTLFDCQMLKEQFRLAAFLPSPLSSFRPSPICLLLALWLPSSSFNNNCSVQHPLRSLVLGNSLQVKPDAHSEPYHLLAFMPFFWVPLTPPSVRPSLLFTSLQGGISSRFFELLPFQQSQYLWVCNYLFYSDTPTIIFSALTPPWAPDCIAI